MTKKYPVNQGGEVFIISARNLAEDGVAYLLRTVKSGNDNPYSEQEFSNAIPTGVNMEVKVFLSGISQINAEYTATDKGEPVKDDYGSYYVHISDFDDDDEEEDVIKETIVE